MSRACLDRLCSMPRNKELSRVCANSSSGSNLEQRDCSENTPLIWAATLDTTRSSRCCSKQARIR